MRFKLGTQTIDLYTFNLWLPRQIRKPPAEFPARLSLGVLIAGGGWDGPASGSHLRAGCHRRKPTVDATASRREPASANQDLRRSMLCAARRMLGTSGSFRKTGRRRGPKPAPSPSFTPRTGGGGTSGPLVHHPHMHVSGEVGFGGSRHGCSNYRLAGIPEMAILVQASPMRGCCWRARQAAGAPAGTALGRRWSGARGPRPGSLRLPIRTARNSAPVTAKQTRLPAASAKAGPITMPATATAATPAARPPRLPSSMGSRNPRLPPRAWSGDPRFAEGLALDQGMVNRD